MLRALLLALSLFPAEGLVLRGAGPPRALRPRPPYRRAGVFAESRDLQSWFEKVKENMAEGEVGERGEAWVAGQAALALAVVVGLPLPTLLVWPLGVGVLGGGAGLALLGVRDLGSSLTPWPTPTAENELQTAGAFSYCRHPIYGGLILGCLGLALLTRSFERLVLTAGLTALLTLKAEREEAMLADRHGAAYTTWAAQTPSLFPSWASVATLLKGPGAGDAE